MLKSLVSISFFYVALTFASTTHSSSRCGDCPLEPLGFRAPSGAYRFDSTVPPHVEQATYWADDSWGYNYHDQSDTNATTITVLPMSPDSYGYYDANANVLAVNQYYVDQCVSACNMLISVMSHEMGHTVGIADITAGCESSIMSWERNREAVIGPSSEDECWFQNWGAGPNWQCPELPCIPYDQTGGKGSKGRGGRGGTSAAVWQSIASERSAL